ncbi:MAG: hypothetical protein KAU46_02550 [Candidatus Aminicenantes bacterium]|nr:hypothetical protein [Candidatus Aminicenantes bacterium]
MKISVRVGRFVWSVWLYPSSKTTFTGTGMDKESPLRSTVVTACFLFVF